MHKFQHKQRFAGNDSIDKMLQIVGKMCSNLNLSRQDIQSLQERKLKEMLAYAKSKSPWYKKRFAHIDVDKFTLDRLQEIPIMTKRELMDNWDDIVTNRQIKFNKAGPFLVDEKDYDLFHGVHLFASGGSSGRRGLFLWSSDEIAEFLAGLYRFQYRDDPYLLNPSEKMRVASVAATRPVHLSQTVMALPLVENMQTLALSSIAPVDDLVRVLNDYQPDYLNGYPSVLKRLAQKNLKGELDIKPRRILVGAEPLMADMVEDMQNAWPEVIIINQWGSTDAGIHAVSCEHSNHNLHLLEDLNILEAVDYNNQPVQNGETSSKVIVTNLHRKSMPVFRYEMDDTVRVIDETCACGSSFKLIGAVDGRKEDDFVYGDIVIMSKIFNYNILPEPGIDEYQVLQTEHGADVHLVPDKGATVNTARIAKALTAEYLKLGVIKPEVNVVCVESLNRHPETGKLKRFKTLAGQDGGKLLKRA